MTGGGAIGTASVIAWINDASSGKQIYTASVASGVIRQQYSASDASSEITLEGEFTSSPGATLVFEAAPGYDSSKPKIVGFDPATGQIRWQVATRVVSSGDKQYVEVSPTGGIVVVSCQDSAETCAFEGVDPLLGTIKNKTTISADLIPDVTPITIGASDVVGNVNDEKVVVINSSSGAVESTWP